MSCLPSKTILCVVTGVGFSIIPSITRILLRPSLKEVTGIVVNRHVNVNSTYRRRLRAMVDRLRSTGSYVRKEPELDGAGSTKLQEKPGTLNQIRSEERRGGKECVGTCRLRRSQYH